MNKLDCPFDLPYQSLLWDNIPRKDQETITNSVTLVKFYEKELWGKLGYRAFSLAERYEMLNDKRKQEVKLSRLCDNYDLNDEAKNYYRSIVNRKTNLLEKELEARKVI